MKINEIQTNYSYYFGNDIEKNILHFEKNKNSYKNHDRINYKHNGDVYHFSNTNSFAENYMKNESVLYNLYSGEADSISSRIIKNEKFMQKLYKDEDFMKASVSALKKTIEDKLADTSLNERDLKELKTLHNILAIQEESQTINQSSLPKNSIQNYTDNNIISINCSKHRQPQLSFGTILNYGFFNKPKSRKQKAEAIVNRCATLAAAESAALLQISTTAETAALTATTIKMCREICKTYQMPGGAVTALVSQITGSMAGKTLASWATKWFPGVGNAANATITYSLHQAQGRAIIIWCENNYDKPEIANWDMLARGLNLFAAADKATPNPVDTLEDIVL